MEIHLPLMCYLNFNISTGGRGYTGVPYYMCHAYGCAFAFLFVDSIVHSYVLPPLIYVHHVIGIGVLICGGLASKGQLLFVAFAAIGEFGSGTRGSLLSFPFLGDTFVNICQAIFNATNALILLLILVNIKMIVSDKFLASGRLSLLSHFE